MGVNVGVTVGELVCDNGGVAYADVDGELFGVKVGEGEGEGEGEGDVDGDMD